MNRRECITVAAITAVLATSVLTVSTGQPADASTGGAIAAPIGAVSAFGAQAPGTNRLVSVRAGGASAQSPSGAGALSADGRYLAFVSADPLLIPGRTIGGIQVYLRDLVTGATALVSRAADGTGGNGPSREPDISADGRRVVFVSAATNLVAADTDARVDVYGYDDASGVVRLISKTPSGSPGNAASRSPAVSADGLHVVYESSATDLDPIDQHFPATRNIFGYDAPTDRTVLISRAVDGGDTSGLGSGEPDISGDGGRVVFHSLAHNLTGGADLNPYEDVFVEDRRTGMIEQITQVRYAHSYGAAISVDGSHVVFSSRGSSFTGEPTAPGEVYNVWKYDLAPAAFTLVTRGYDASPANASSYGPQLSADGRLVSYASDARNLVPGDANGSSDVFGWNAATMQSLLLSRGPAGQPADDASYGATVSANGAFVAYTSVAGNIAPRDANRVSDAFAYRLY